MKGRLTGGGISSPLRRLFGVMLCASLTVTAGFAQAGKGAISGRVADTSGAVLTRLTEPAIASRSQKASY